MLRATGRLSVCLRIRSRLSISQQRTLTYHFPIMGVTVSSKKESKVLKRVPKPSFASFSTTGTLTSVFAEEGEEMLKG